MGPTGRATPRLVAALSVVAVVFAVGANGAGHRLRAQAQPPAGKPGTEATIEGDLEVLIEDSDRGSRILYFLHAGDQRIALRFPSDPPELATGTRVRVHGRWDNDGALVVSSIETVRAPRSAGKPSRLRLTAQAAIRSAETRSRIFSSASAVKDAYYSKTIVRFSLKNTRSSRTSFNAFARTIFSTSLPACAISFGR